MKFIFFPKQAFAPVFNAFTLSLFTIFFRYFFVIYIAIYINPPSFPSIGAITMAKKQEITAEYNLLKEKYGLPDFDKLNDEFEIYNNFIGATDIPEFLLRNIRRRMVEKFYSWINYLHNFIFANQQSLILMNEYQQFSDEEREEIIMIINKIMFINRLSVKLEVHHKEEEDALFIKKYFDEWPMLKEQLMQITSKNIEGWQNSLTPKEEKSKDFFSF